MLEYGKYAKGMKKKNGVFDYDNDFNLFKGRIA